MISSKPSNRFVSVLSLIAGRILPVCIIFVLTLSLSSCDFLRKMAGRPTSSELALLEKKRDSLEIERRLKHKRPAVPATDTASVAAADTSASVATADTLAQAGGAQPGGEPVTDASQIQTLKAGCGHVLLYNLSRFRGSRQASELFYIIAGTFKEAENAERYVARLQRGDLPQARALTLGNGYTLAAVMGSSDAGLVLRFMTEHKAELPPEAWILINNLR